MSAGQSTIRIYEADSAEKHLLRQQPESATFLADTVANVVLTGPATSPFWAKTSRGAREYGLRPRKLRGQWNPGQAPDGYDDCGEFAVVIYSKAVYDGAVISGPCTYLGGTGTIIGRIPEDIYPAV